jgi:hypothetical protein
MIERQPYPTHAPTAQPSFPVITMVLTIVAAITAWFSQALINQCSSLWTFNPTTCSQPNWVGFHIARFGALVFGVVMLTLFIVRLVHYLEMRDKC